MGGEQEHGPSLDEIHDEGTIRIPSEELRRLLNENARLNDQVRELHGANSALVEENREARKFEKRVGDVLRDRSTALGMFRGMKSTDVLIGEAFDTLEREIVRPDAADRAVMVREFFERVVPHQERLPSPGVPSEPAVRFQAGLVFEEFVELLEAVFDDRAKIDQVRYSLRWFLDMSPLRLRADNLLEATEKAIREYIKNEREAGEIDDGTAGVWLESVRSAPYGFSGVEGFAIWVHEHSKLEPRIENAHELGVYRRSSDAIEFVNRIWPVFVRMLREEIAGERKIDETKEIGRCE